MKTAKKIERLMPYSPTPDIYKTRLDANESFMTPPDFLLQRITKAISEVALNRYPDPDAKALRTAAADYYGVATEQVAAGNGSDELISILLSTFLEKGSRILVSEPDFSMYGFYADLYEISVTSCKKNEIIEAAHKSNPDMIIFSNPCNPTGLGLNADAVMDIVRACDCYVVVDEAYMEFWNQSVISQIKSFRNLIVLRTCSKALGLAAVRCGFVISNEKTIENIMKVKSPFNVNALTQAAALEILREKDYIISTSEKIVASKNTLYRELSKFCDVSESVTNFVVVRTPHAERVWKNLKRAGISVRKIMGDCLRITAGSERENMAVIANLKEELL
ncbi:MAG: histidinol-phosphate transaminase [Clostridia bacterium]